MTTKMERYTTTAGEVIEYAPPADDVARYLARVIDAAHDPRVSEGELVELVYSKDNPLLDSSVMPGRGAVTREVFANPVYHVMHDLLFAKRLQMEHAERTGEVVQGLSVTEVAEQLEMSESAVRQAVRRGDLVAAKVRGAHSIDPASVATYRGRVKRRGPEPTRVELSGTARGTSTVRGDLSVLRVRMGNEPGHSMKVKAPNIEVLEKRRLENEGRLTEAVVPSFQRVAVFTTGKTTAKVYELEPADEDCRIEFGSFLVEGKFRIARKQSGPSRAAAAFKAFVPT